MNYWNVLLLSLASLLSRVGILVAFFVFVYMNSPNLALIFAGLYGIEYISSMLLTKTVSSMLTKDPAKELFK